MVAGPEQICHFGVVVPDLAEGMAEYTRVFGTTWPDPLTLERDFRLGDGTVFGASLRVVYSREGPPWVEMMQEIPGTPWTAVSPAGVHHVAVWSDDIVGDSRELVAAGAVLELTYDGPEPVQGFAYHRLVNGTRFELVDVSLRSGIEEWTRS